MSASLPVNWTVEPLGDLAHVYSGGTPSRAVPAYWGGNIPWITTTDIDGGYIESARQTITDAGANASAARIARPSTLLLAMYGQGKTRGKVAMLGISAAMNQACAAVEAGSRLDPHFLLHYLSLRYEAIRSMSNAGSQENLSGELIRRIPIAVPPVEEQRKIADVIGDSDVAVSALRQMIAKKRAIKRGMMQQLLTGKIRLPGFVTAWTQIELGELLEFRNGLNKGSKYFGSGTPIVNFMDVMNAPIITSEDVGGRVTLTTDEIKRFSAKRGDLFFTRTSETVGEVGTAATLVDGVPDAAFSGFLLRGRPRRAEIDSRFIAYLFQLDAVRQQVSASATYTTRALTNGRSLGRVVIRLPDGAEQRAIADVIDDVDLESYALYRRLDKARMIKQGMMQELLTGRTRLPVREAAA